jgi:hypothetical protein
VLGLGAWENVATTIASGQVRGLAEDFARSAQGSCGYDLIFRISTLTHLPGVARSPLLMANRLLRCMQAPAYRLENDTMRLHRAFPTLPVMEQIRAPLGSGQMPPSRVRIYQR